METLMYVVPANTYVIPVLILPMRNGNSFSYKSSAFKLPSSYPTYEEWKPFFFKLL